MDSILFCCICFCLKVCLICILLIRGNDNDNVIYIGYYGVFNGIHLAVKHPTLSSIKNAIIMLSFVSGSQCVIEQPVSDIGGGGRDWNHLRDVKFTCQTNVVGWKFYAQIIDDVYVGVMRHISGNSYQVTYIQR